MQYHPATEPPEPCGLLLHRRAPQIIQLFRKFAPALRQQESRAVQFVGRVRQQLDGFLKFAFLGQLRPASLANRDMFFDRASFLLLQFIARIEHQEFGNFFAGLFLLPRVHRSTPNSLRNFRVARNSEFFTVSSLVPSASPIARNFSP